MNRARSGSDGWPLVVLLAATQLAAFNDRFLMALVASPVKAALALSDAQIGLLQGSAFALPYALVSPVFGGLADRGHRRSLLVAGIVLWSAATVAFGLAGGFATMLASRLVLGLGQASVLPAALSLMAVRLDGGRLGRGISFLTAGGSLGRSAALLGGGAILAWLTAQGAVAVPGLGDLAPWRRLLLFAIVPNLMLALLLLRIREAPARPKPLRRALALGWIRRRLSAYLPHAAAATATVLMAQTLAAWAPTFYVRAFGLTPAESGLHLGLVVLLGAPIGHLAGGIVLDRMRKGGDLAAAPRLLALCLILALPATTLMSLAPALMGSLAGFAALVVLLGLASPPGLGGIQFLTPRALRGGVTAFFLSAVTLIATGIGPLLVGLLNDAVFGQAGLGKTLLAVFTVTSGLGTLCAFLAVLDWRMGLRLR